MKALKELVYLITRHKRKQIEILGYNDDATSNHEIFYGLIENGRLDSDDEAARYFFGKDKDGSFIQYKNLCNDLFDRLVNTMFFIDLKKPKFNDAQAAAHNCGKYAAAVKMLAARENRHAAFKLAKSTIVPAIQYELTEIVLDLARYLRSYYTTAEQDLKKKDYYEELIKSSLEILDATVKAENMYYDLITPYIKSRSSKPWISEKARKYMEELDPFIHKYQDYKLHFHYYFIALMERASIHDHAGTAEVCRKAISYLEKKEATTNTVLGMFSYTLIISLTMLGQFEEAEAAVRYSEDLVEDGTHNWFKGLEQHLVLKFYKQDYQAAWEVFQKAAKHKKFGHLATGEQETWKIFEGYIQLLIEAGKIQLSDNKIKKAAFKPARFLNEIPEFSKDKRGMNIPVLIVHAIFLLYQGRYDESWDRMLALDKYADRHLKEGDDAFRSHCFIKALLQIKNADFKKEAAETAAAGWLRRMSTQQVQYANAPHEIEAIPYDHLWGMAMEAIERGVDIEESSGDTVESVAVSG